MLKSHLDPVQTVFHIATMQEIVSSSVQSRPLGAVLLSVFAGLALVVAAPDCTAFSRT
jgi:hypothetical protein